MQYQHFVEKIKQETKSMHENQKKNHLREELQRIILQTIYTEGNENVYFLGGTNLRITYKLDRFSEDLDFALEEPNPRYNFESFIGGISQALSEKGFTIEISNRNPAAVRKSLIKFPNILKDTGISQTRDEKISIKIEIDTNPAQGAEYENKIIHTANGPTRIRIQDIQTTFAGKMGAFLLREYSKGRDYYDMYWYLEQQGGKKFNLVYLQSVIEQYNINNNGNVQIPKTHKDALNQILEKAEEADYSKMAEDLERFVDWHPRVIQEFYSDYKGHLARATEEYYSSLNKQKKTFRLQ